MGKTFILVSFSVQRKTGIKHYILENGNESNGM